MIQVARLCQAIADVLNSQEWSHEFTAEQKWVTSIYAENAAGLTVTLVPESEQKTAIARGAKTQNTVVLSVIAQKRVEDPSEVDGLVALTQALDHAILEHRLFKTIDGTWSYVSSETGFIREHLEQFSVFTCGAALTFTGVMS